MCSDFRKTSSDCVVGTDVATERSKITGATTPNKHAEVVSPIWMLAHLALGE